MGTVNPGYLIPYIRLTIGDIDSTAYRYTNEWIRIALTASIDALTRWWGSKYLIDANELIYRDSLSIDKFVYDEPPVIQAHDVRPIVLMASIILLEGSLESNAYNLASWRDNEISFTNLEMGRIKNSNIQRLWDELNSLLTPPTKKLASALKGSLPGYLNNDFERERSSKY